MTESHPAFSAADYLCVTPEDYKTLLGRVTEMMVLARSRALARERAPRTRFGRRDRFGRRQTVARYRRVRTYLLERLRVARRTGSPLTGR